MFLCTAALTMTVVVSLRFKLIWNRYFWSIMLIYLQRVTSTHTSKIIQKKSFILFLFFYYVLCLNLILPRATWPTAKGYATQKSLIDPAAPIHILTGCAGAPGAIEQFKAPLDFTRRTVSAWSYGRVTVHNSTHLTYQHVFNTNGSLADEFTVIQSKRLQH